MRAALATPRLTVHELLCGSPRSGKGPTRGGESTHVVFVRRGMFAAHVGSRRFLADPCTALVSWEGLEYQISHPCHGGDDCTVFELDAALADELLAGLEPRRDLELRLTPAHFAAYAGFTPHLPHPPISSPPRSGPSPWSARSQARRPARVPAPRVAGSRRPRSSCSMPSSRARRRYRRSPTRSAARRTT